MRFIQAIIASHKEDRPAIDTARKLSSEDMLERLSDLFVRHGVPAYIRSRPTLRVGARGPEFTAGKVREWLPGSA